jgi:hypothetical protein
VSTTIFTPFKTIKEKLVPFFVGQTQGRTDGAETISRKGEETVL